MTQVVVALCHHGHLGAEDSAPFITYLVRNAANGNGPQRRTTLVADAEGESGNTGF